MKTRITPRERLQLIGLLTLAGKHDRALRDVLLVAKDLLGDAEPYSHIDDAVWDDKHRDADRLLKLLNIEVRAETADESVVVGFAGGREDLGSSRG